MLDLAGCFSLLGLLHLARDFIEGHFEGVFAFLEFLDGVGEFHLRGPHGVDVVGLAKDVEEGPVAVVD